MIKFMKIMKGFIDMGCKSYEDENDAIKGNI